MAQEAQVDVVTHAPLDKALDEAAVARMVAENRISVPTLTMMEGIIEHAHPPGSTYAPARATVTAFYEAGVPILAGTDANHANRGRQRRSRTARACTTNWSCWWTPACRLLMPCAPPPHCRPGTSVSPTAASSHRAAEPIWC